METSKYQYSFYLKNKIIKFVLLFRVRGLSLDLIKRRLDGNQYKRLDTFQDDLFACLERARQLSRTDSQVFEDSIELQSYFIRQRFVLYFNQIFSKY